MEVSARDVAELIWVVWHTEINLPRSKNSYAAETWIEIARANLDLDKIPSISSKPNHVIDKIAKRLEQFQTDLLASDAERRSMLQFRPDLVESHSDVEQISFQDGHQMMWVAESHIYNLLPRIHQKVSRNVPEDYTPEWLRNEFTSSMMHLRREFPQSTIWYLSLRGQYERLLLAHTPISRDVIKMILLWLSPHLPFFEHRFALPPFNQTAYPICKDSLCTYCRLRQTNEQNKLSFEFDRMLLQSGHINLF